MTAKFSNTFEDIHKSTYDLQEALETALQKLLSFENLNLMKN